jgi:hypothetical protein
VYQKLFLTATTVHFIAIVCSWFSFQIISIRVHGLIWRLIDLEDPPRSFAARMALNFKTGGPLHIGTGLPDFSWSARPKLEKM